MTSGSDVKRQAMEALDEGTSGAEHWRNLASAFAALAPCVVLTREEADALLELIGYHELPKSSWQKAFLILTPDEPREGEADDLAQGADDFGSGIGPSAEYDGMTC